MKSSLHGSTISTAGNRENFVGWELMTVPSGPDPLHHNGGSPKKPRTDPLVIPRLKAQKQVFLSFLSNYRA